MKLNFRSVVLGIILAIGLGFVVFYLAPRLTARAGCDIRNPKQPMPAALDRVRLGISRKDLESILGKSDYSPTKGQYYFSTGGSCPIEGTTTTSACGVVADFRLLSGSDTQLTDSLQSCFWGAIGE
jgi:hypothetical protein